MPFVDRLFLYFGWLQIWKPAKQKGWVQRFFHLKVQMVWHLSFLKKTVIKLCGKVGYNLIFFFFKGGKHRAFWPSQGNIKLPKTDKCNFKSPVLIFASSPCVFAFVYVLEYAWAAVCPLGGFPSHLVTEANTSFGNILSCLRCFLLLPCVRHEMEKIKK